MVDKTDNSVQGGNVTSSWVDGKMKVTMGGIDLTLSALDMGDYEDNPDIFDSITSVSSSLSSRLKSALQLVSLSAIKEDPTMTHERLRKLTCRPDDVFRLFTAITTQAGFTLLPQERGE